MDTFWIENTEDETVELFIGERRVGMFNHDEHGFTGMNSAIKLFEKVASVLGAKLERR